MSEPCMSCGEDRRLPAPHRCKHQANHHPAPSLAERERLLDLLEKWFAHRPLRRIDSGGKLLDEETATLLREYDRLGKEES